MKFLDDLAILSLDIEVIDSVSGFGVSVLYNLPVPYGVDKLFLSENATIDSSGDIYLEENTLAGTKINTTITYRYE